VQQEYLQKTKQNGGWKSPDLAKTLHTQFCFFVQYVNQHKLNAPDVVSGFRSFWASSLSRVNAISDLCASGNTITPET